MLSLYDGIFQINGAKKKLDPFVGFDYCIISRFDIQ